MIDECVGHMVERVVIPPTDEIKVIKRRYTGLPPAEYLPFKPCKDLVPEIIRAGDGYRIHATGLTHDEKGYPVINAQAQERLIQRLVDKIRLNADKIIRFKEEGTEDADIIVISYGITSRVAIRAIQMTLEKGIKVGSLRLIVTWPFPEKRVFELSRKIKAFVVPEMNMGQIFYEVDRVSRGNCETVLVPHAGGTVHDPKVIFDAIIKAAK
jgi:2-oxoglutarate ferredoxin oxidoreductase subunit alpha